MLAHDSWPRREHLAFMRLSQLRSQFLDGLREADQREFPSGPSELARAKYAIDTSGLVQPGKEKAFDCIVSQRIEQDLAVVALLKHCAKQKDLDTGNRLHASILERGLLGKNIFIGNTLVSMYAKCGALSMAQHAFDELPCQDVVSWNALVAGYSQHEHAEKAITCFIQMQHEGHLPNIMTFASVLKACSSIGAFITGKEVHVHISTACYSGIAANKLNALNGEKETKEFVGMSNVLGSALLDMYAKCGALQKAQEVFDELQVTDVVCWTALIRGYFQHGHGERAFRCFEQMKCEGLSPDTVTFACILKVCGSRGAAEKGEMLHAELVSKGLLGKDIVLDSALLDMYAKCGALLKAHQVFNELPSPDLVAWNSLIAGYTQHGHGVQALKCFVQMQHRGPSPDQVSFVCILKACASVGAGEMGKLVHAEIVRRALLGINVSLGNALVDMYAKCGALARAQEVFDELSVQDVVSWNALVAGYAQHGHGKEAIECYMLMLQEGLFPSTVTFACVLKACGSIGASEKGKEVHAEIVRNGVLESGAVVGNALVDMYCKCGELKKAQQIFYELPHKDVVSWNVLILGFCEQGNAEGALSCFEQMTLEGLSPNEVTFICILKACGNIQAVEKGREIHGEIARKGLLEKSVMLGSALVDMYAKCGVLAEAQEVFVELRVQDAVSWNALIIGYCDHGNYEEAISCFYRGKHEELTPDSVTFVIVLKACSSIGAVEKGSELHAEIMRKGFLANSSEVGNAVVGMYAKCGLLSKAKQAFDELPVRDVASWNVLITGYSDIGLGEEALNCFHHMEYEGISPDSVTFVCVLKACGSTGAPDKGQLYFEIMSVMYGVSPMIEHQTCMVYLNGLAGNFEKAMADIEKWPFSDSLPAWLALLGACQKRGNVNLARLAFNQALQLDK